jgi:Protein of unknown function (DUF4239)
VETFLVEHIPPLVLSLAIVALTVALAVGGLVLVRRSVELGTLEAHHDVAGFILAVVGVVYAVLLAFLVVVVWQQYEDSRATANEEAVVVGTLYRDALALGPTGPPARLALAAYARSVIDSEWPEMAAHQRESRETDRALDRVWHAFRVEHPPARHLAPFHAEAIQRLHEVSQLRRTRVFDSQSAMPPPLWGVLIAGGLITVGFTYFFAVSNFRARS